jgi:choline dehydrogenase-like flavoprotein
MTYMRAESSQIDAWKLLGNNITWNSLLPYYKRSEGFQTPTAAQRVMGASYDPEYHGYTGPLSVSWPNEMVGDNFSSILKETFKSIDLPWNDDANNGQMRGYNILNATAQRMTWEPESHASKPFSNGVTFQIANGTEMTILADREVVLSAGALMSPLLLELSGVGNKQ